MVRTIKQKVYNLQAFVIMVGGHIVINQIYPHALITKVFQWSNNCVIRTVAELRKNVKRAIKALIYVLLQLIHKPHGWHTLDRECKGVLSIGL